MKKHFETFPPIDNLVGEGGFALNLSEANDVITQVVEYEVVGLPVIVRDVRYDAGAVISGPIEERLLASLIAGGNLREA